MAAEQTMQALLSDPLMPGGEGSREALRSALAALGSGDARQAHAHIAKFIKEAQAPEFIHSPDLATYQALAEELARRSSPQLTGLKRMTR